MQIHLVVWSEIDSGFDIVEAYKSIDKATAKVKALESAAVEKEPYLQDYWDDKYDYHCSPWQVITLKLQ
jgi:hypothetical protein